MGRLKTCDLTFFKLKECPLSTLRGGTLLGAWVLLRNSKQQLFCFVGFLSYCAHERRRSWAQSRWAKKKFFFISCAPSPHILKSMTSQLSLKKINVSRQKFIENERNEILKFFNFFQKKKQNFSNFENPLKKTAPGAVFLKSSFNLKTV